MPGISDASSTEIATLFRESFGRETGPDVIVTATDDGGLRLVTQNDHAAWAADLLSAWPGLLDWCVQLFPEDPARLRRLVLDATRHHDNGWLELDSAPSIQRDGTPHDFQNLPSDERSALWQRGAERYRDSRPAMTTLILRHALYLLSLGGEPPAAVVRELEEDLDLLLEEMCERDDDHAWLHRQLSELAYDWVQLADAISLEVCASRKEEVRLQAPALASAPRLGPFEIEIACQEAACRQTLRLRPFPFKGTLTLPIRCRFVRRQRFESSTDLVLALAADRWRSVPVRIEPL